MRTVIDFMKNSFFLVVKKVIGKWRYFVILSERRAEDIRKIHYTDEVRSDISNDGSVVFISNGMTPMGGLCDRLKGIVSAYAWCKDHDVPFKILFTSPFHLDKYLVPNEYDWQADDQNVSFSKDSDVVCVLYTFDIADIVNSGEALIKTQQYFDKRLVRGRNHQVHIYSNAQTPSANARFGSLFNELFRPHDSLEAFMDVHRQRLGSDYISVSFRFTTLLGDLQDCTGEPLSKDEAENYISVCLKSIDDIASRYAPHKKILVTADSTTFLTRVSNPACYIIPGKIGHIQFDSGEEMNMKTFLDLMMISEAEKVYLVRYKKMYNSGFARTAAMINSKPFVVYDPSSDS